MCGLLTQKVMSKVKTVRTRPDISKNVSCRSAVKYVKKERYNQKRKTRQLNGFSGNRQNDVDLTEADRERERERNRQRVVRSNQTAEEGSSSPMSAKSNFHKTIKSLSDVHRVTTLATMLCSLLPSSLSALHLLHLTSSSEPMQECPPHTSKTMNLQATLRSYTITNLTCVY